MAHHHQPEDDPRDPRRKTAFPAPREEWSDHVEGNPSTSRQHSRSPHLRNGDKPKGTVHPPALAITPCEKGSKRYCHQLHGQSDVSLQPWEDLVLQGSLNQKCTSQHAQRTSPTKRKTLSRGRSLRGSRDTKSHIPKHPWHRVGG